MDLMMQKAIFTYKYCCYASKSDNLRCGAVNDAGIEGERRKQTRLDHLSVQPALMNEPSGRAMKYMLRGQT
jgi:hypothetical protein